MTDDELIALATLHLAGKSDGDTLDLLPLLRAVVAVEQERIADAVRNAAGEHAQTLRIGFERYETARRMNPRQWADAWNLNISTGKGFDEIVDDLRPFLRA